jgi:hypothetical protein
VSSQHRLSVPVHRLPVLIMMPSALLNLRVHSLHAAVQNCIHCVHVFLRGKFMLPPYRNSVQGIKHLPLFYMVYICINLGITLTFTGSCIVNYSYNQSQRDALFLKFIVPS